MPYIKRMALAVAEWLKAGVNEDAAALLQTFAESDAIHHGFLRQSNKTADLKHAPDTRFRMDTMRSGAEVLCISNVNVRSAADLWIALVHASLWLAARAIAEGDKPRLYTKELTAEFRAIGLRPLPGRKAQAGRYYFASTSNGKARKGFDAAVKADASLGEMPATFVGNDKAQPTGKLMVKVTIGDWAGVMVSVPNPETDLAGAVEAYGTMMGRSPAPTFWDSDADDRKAHKPTLKFITPVLAALEQAKAEAA